MEDANILQVLEPLTTPLVLHTPTTVTVLPVTTTAALLLGNCCQIIFERKLLTFWIRFDGECGLEKS